MNEAQKFALVRSALNMSQREMAQQIGTSQAILSNIEMGKSPVTRKILDKLQSQYSLNIDWFINTRGEMFGKPQTEITSIAGDDKDEIIRLLKEQIHMLRTMLKDKEEIIRHLRDTVRMESDSN